MKFKKSDLNWSPCTKRIPPGSCRIYMMIDKSNKMLITFSAN